MMDEHDIEWTCGCGHHNPDYDTGCRGCGDQRYPPEEPIVSEHLRTRTPRQPDWVAASLDGAPFHAWPAPLPPTFTERQKPFADRDVASGEFPF